MPAGADPQAPDGPGNAPEGAHDALVFTLPNAITFARLCAVPATIWLVLQHRLDLAFWMFLAAGISDGVDGWLARVRNARSRLGAILDPLADKALLVSIYVTLAAIGVLPDWLAILVVFRDLVIVGGVIVLYLAGQPPAIQPILLSKANTALQIGLAALALMVAGFGLPGEKLVAALVWLVAASTFASGAVYVWRTARRTR
ncbi:CDP-alcohol phosphatidyltransferase family protein [Roseomonas sp. AR75]|uniref:CDP-alcohol phosphatidyltransferase family protein n=1 Tax=Roseomonas sp. AR75 TaxID=2562311 RepID=UPI0010BF7CF0|nr:CDP-alcohol phosphatidyltransferase family protein [Roseomonas sp. AR75]